MTAADPIYPGQTTHAGLWQELVQRYQLVRRLGVSCIDVEAERLQQATSAAPIAAIDPHSPATPQH